MKSGCICGADAIPQAYLPGLLRCPECTHVWADMELSPEELQSLYSENYFLGEEYLDYAKEAPALQRNFTLRLRELKARVPEGTLWEIGSAYGHFLEMASRHYTVSGCDISEHAANFARDNMGQRVVCGDYLTIDLPADQDVICLWDTVEHLAAPDQYLAHAERQLRPGGLLALSTGDISAWMARFRGEKWRLIHPPTHLHYFTAQSMTLLLSRLGFVDIEINYYPFWRSADAVAYRLLGYPETRWSAPLYRALRKTPLLNFTFPVNTHDLMTVYARKKTTTTPMTGQNT